MRCATYSLSLALDVISRDEMGLPKDEIEETGTTFEENSYIKASSIAKQCDGIVVADDSGIAVDCIGGKPGVYSARLLVKAVLRMTTM